MFILNNQSLARERQWWQYENVCTKGRPSDSQESGGRKPLSWRQMRCLQEGGNKGIYKWVSISLRGGIFKDFEEGASVVHH